MSFGSYKGKIKFYVLCCLLMIISSSAYARKPHGIHNDDSIDNPITKDPINDTKPKWSLWKWILSLLKNKGDNSENHTKKIGGNGETILGTGQSKTEGTKTTGLAIGGTENGGIETGETKNGGTENGETENGGPKPRGCRNLLKRLLVALLGLFLLRLLLAFLVNFFDSNNNLSKNISNSIDSIKNGISNKPYDFIINSGSIDNYIGKDNVKIVPISNNYYEIITNDKSLINGDIPLGTIDIPNTTEISCPTDSKYRNINSSTNGLNYNEFVYDYLSEKQEKDIVIAILDSGIDTDNKNLVGHIAKNSKEYNNFIDDDNNGYTDDIKGVNISSSNGKIDDTNGHGTHVAGIILQTFPNAQLLPIKLNNGTTDIIDDINIIKGLRYAIDNNVDIINMSLGGKGNNDVIDELINEATEKGIITIAAAGNEGQNINIYYPANVNGVISVGSISMTGIMSDFSNYGSDTLFPGECIYSYGINDDMVFMKGTSMAVPHLAGVLGAYLSLGNDLGGENDILQLIDSSARKVGKESLLDITKLLGLGDESETINENILSMTGIINNIENNIKNIKSNGGKTDSIVSKENINSLSNNTQNIINLYTGLSIKSGFSYNIKDLIDNYTTNLKKLHENSVYLTTEGGVLEGSLGLGLKGNKYQILIKSGTTLPAKGSYTTSNTISEHNIYLTVYQGDNQYAGHNTQLGKFTFQLANRTPIRTAKLKVDFDVNEYGKLTVKAYEPDNPSKPPITPTINGLIQRDSDDFSDENKEIRDIINNIDDQSKKISERINNYYDINPNIFIPEKIDGILNNTGYNEDIIEVNYQNTGNIINKPDNEKYDDILYDYLVTKVSDGDTLRVKKNGQSFKIRLVGVEAPENTTTRYGYTQCYGQASTDYLTKLLLNKYVGLEYDTIQNGNSYDRELAYVIFEGENISKKIIEEGYGRAYTGDYRYKSEFLETEHEAKRLEKGLWNKNTCGGIKQGN